MNKQLAGYYQLTTKEFDKLWKESLIVVDTNVLLNLYRYSDTTSKKILLTLKQFSDRLWIPNQVEHEFTEKRLDVIEEQKKVYKSLIDAVEKSEKSLNQKFSEHTRHPFIDIKKLQREIQQDYLKIKNDLQQIENTHPDYFEKDPILIELTSLFNGKIGESYSDQQLQGIFIEGKKRYESNVPPGYLDTDKTQDLEKYGDLILWFQIIDKAKSSCKSIILVNDEKKGDWWFIKKGNIFGPRPELIDEIQQKANVLFYMYNSNRFVLFAQEFLRQSIDQETQKELMDIRSDKDILEAERDEEVRIESDRDSFIIGFSVKFSGYSYTNEKFVRLIIFGPGQFSEGIEIARPPISDSNYWTYDWRPDLTIESGQYTAIIYDPKKRISDEVTVLAEKGAVTITASGDGSYFIGERIKFSGTSTASKSVCLAIIGPSGSPEARKLDNLSIISQNGDQNSFVKVNVRSDSTWSYLWDTSKAESLTNEGVYSVYAIEGPFTVDNLTKRAFGSVSIIIKRPYVVATVNQSVIAKGDKIIIRGIAEGILHQKVQVWIFGTSFTYQEIIRANSDTSYEYQLPQSITKTLIPGNYYTVVHHPMINNAFDVYLDEQNKKIMINIPKMGTPLFPIDGPGSLHGIEAAMELAKAINNPEIDDTYEKLQFLIEEPFIQIDPIGDRYIGDLFTITALTNLAVDDEILIEVYSSKFNPNQKTQPGDYSGAVGTVKVTRGDTGLNKISFNIDTSAFKPDEYIVKVSAMTLDAKTSITFKIVHRGMISSILKKLLTFFRV